ncbi:hypothetical protein [Mycobacterium sherrisii]|nr:hypothetical protein [Mycobacterium sherrisii]
MTTLSPTVQYQGRGLRRRWSLAVASTVTAAMLMIAAAHHPAIARASDDSIDIVPGVAIIPAPGWTAADRGPNWVALSNADSSAQLQVAVKPTSAPDAVATLQADIDQLSATAGADLTNVQPLTAPKTKALQGNNFQQEAFVDYTATAGAPQGPVPVLGTFSELWNTTSRQTAFVYYRQNHNATSQAVNDGGAMIASML